MSYWSFAAHVGRLLINHHLYLFIPLHISPVLQGSALEAHSLGPIPYWQLLFDFNSHGRTFNSHVSLGVQTEPIFIPLLAMCSTQTDSVSSHIAAQTHASNTQTEPVSAVISQEAQTDEPVSSGPAHTKCALQFSLPAGTNHSAVSSSRQGQATAQRRFPVWTAMPGKIRTGGSVAVPHALYHVHSSTVAMRIAAGKT